MDPKPSKSSRGSSSSAASAFFLSLVPAAAAIELTDYFCERLAVLADSSFELSILLFRSFMPASFFSGVSSSCLFRDASASSSEPPELPPKSTEEPAIKAAYCWAQIRFTYCYYSSSCIILSFSPIFFSSLSKIPWLEVANAFAKKPFWMAAGSENVTTEAARATAKNFEAVF